MSYHRILANNRLPKDWEKDDEGVWRLKHGNTRASISRDTVPDSTRDSVETPSASYTYTDGSEALADIDTDATSVSSTTVEPETDHPFERHGEETGTDDRDFVCQGASWSSSSTPGPQDMPVPTTAALLKGLGNHLLDAEEPRWKPKRLVETYDDYQASFVAYKKDLAYAAMQAALNNESRQAADHESYQLQVLSHDDLCRSNGPERIKEERAAICVFIKAEEEDSRAPHSCRICTVPPDYYDLHPPQSLPLPSDEDTVHTVEQSRAQSVDLEQQQWRIKKRWRSRNVFVVPMSLLIFVLLVLGLYFVIISR